MTMKKILAGVMAAATMMTVGATAFAVEAPEQTKAVTKPGETEYEAGVSVMSVELDVELPGQMKAFINPYGAEVAIDTATTPAKLSTGVLSWGYEIVNNTKDFGILVDVKDGKATVSNTVDLKKPSEIANTLTKKAVAIQLNAGATAADVVTASATDVSANAAATASGQGKFLFTDTATTQAKFAYAPAKTTEAGKVVLGFSGKITTEITDSGKTVAAEWTDEDTVTLSFILKINPAKTTQAAAFA